MTEQKNILLEAISVELVIEGERFTVVARKGPGGYRTACLPPDKRALDFLSELLSKSLGPGEVDRESAPGLRIVEARPEDLSESDALRQAVADLLTSLIRAGLERESPTVLDAIKRLSAAPSGGAVRQVVSGIADAVAARDAAVVAVHLCRLRQLYLRQLGSTPTRLVEEKLFELGREAAEGGTVRYLFDRNGAVMVELPGPQATVGPCPRRVEVGTGGLELPDRVLVIEQYTASPVTENELAFFGELAFKNLSDVPTTDWFGPASSLLALPLLIRCARDNNQLVDGQQNRWPLVDESGGEVAALNGLTTTWTLDWVLVRPSAGAATLGLVPIAALGHDSEGSHHFIRIR